jgi:hypothetical protein
MNEERPDRAKDRGAIWTMSTKRTGTPPLYRLVRSSWEQGVYAGIERHPCYRNRSDKDAYPVWCPCQYAQFIICAYCRRLVMVITPADTLWCSHVMEAQAHPKRIWRVRGE